MTSVIKMFTLETKEKFDRALKLKKKGELCRSLSLLQEIIKEYPDFVAAYGMLGDVLWDMNRLEEAIGSFKKVVELNPKSELGSLGLFHLLIEVGKDSEAFEEMRRYLKISHSIEYETIIKEMRNNEGG